MIYRVVLAAVSAGLIGLGSAPAQAQILQRVSKVEIRIAPNLAVTETLRQEATPLVESAVRAAAQAQWVVNDTEQFEVVEAFTRKKDGRIVKADPRDFVTQDGSIGAAMSFVDLKIRQIPFRDVAVGDTTVLAVRITGKSNYFPTHYSRSLVEMPSNARKTVEVILRAPGRLDIRHDEQQFAYEETRDGEEIVRRWSATINAAPEERNTADLALAVPSLRISTFSGYEAIADAYYAEAKSKAVVTPEVQRLAEEITADKPDVRAQAEAIYNWVTRNIRYVAVYFGSGRHVPNDTSLILSRRFGDCKDAATLVTALLATKGIDSEHVLINANPTYQLPKTATLGAFNHVIVYIPALDRYVDPTVSFGSFNRLPSADLGKPVVRISAKGTTIARTPVLSPEENVMEIETRMTGTRDGGRQGQTTIQARGEFAEVMRAFVAESETKGKDVVLGALAQQRGLLGSFDLDAPAWTEARDTYKVTTRWDTPKSTNPADTKLSIPAGFSPILPSPELFFGPLGQKKRVYPAACRAGRIVHTVHLTLPGNVTQVKLPPPLKKSTPQFSVTEEWSRDGLHLRKRTEIRALVAGRVCSPDEVEKVRVALQSVQNRNSSVLYATRAATPQARPSPLRNFFGGGGQPQAAPPRAGTARRD